MKKLLFVFLICCLVFVGCGRSGFLGMFGAKKAENGTEEPQKKVNEVRRTVGTTK